MPSTLADTARELGLDLDDRALDRLERYRDLIAAAAERFNLTAVREPGAIERRHLVESLALAALLVREGLLAPGQRVLDIGSGAGLPGLPIAIVRTDVAVTLLEANAKRCAFLRESTAALGLNVTILEGRAETLGHVEGQRAGYDLVLARAVAPLPVLLEYALPFLRTGGRLAATKGSAAESELAASGRALAVLGGELTSVLSFEPPDGLPQTLVVVTKAGETPAAYPRRVGIPSKRPLL